MTSAQKDLFLNWFYTTFGFGYALILVNSWGPAWWITFLADLNAIGQGLGLFLAALFGFLSLSVVSWFNHIRAIKRAEIDRAHRRDSLTRALGEELKLMWASNEAILEAVRQMAARDDMKEKPMSQSVQKSTEGHLLTGHIFRAVKPEDLGLLPADVVANLITFHMVIEWARTQMEGGTTFTKLIEHYERVQTAGQVAAKSMGFKLTSIF